MHRTRIALLGLCLALAPVAGRATEPAAAEASVLETVLSLQVDGELDVAADGRVAAYRIDTRLTDGVRASLDRAIPTWRFEPRYAGEALAPVTVKMQLSLRAQQTGETYRVTLENVRMWNKDRATASTVDTDAVTITPTRLTPPRYPAALLGGGVEGKVLVGLLLAPDGTVARAEVVQSQLYDAKGQEGALRKALGLFERSTLEDARRWKFKVGTQGGVPTPADLTVFVPVGYVFDAHGPVETRWRTVVRTAKRPPDWLPTADDRTRLGVADVGNGGAVPEAPRVRLAADPSGTAL
jgi:hypothetical protein